MLTKTILKDPDWPSGRSAVDYYFIEEDGGHFKATVTYSPYFFVICKPDTENDAEEYLRKRFSNIIEKIERIEKEDLDLVRNANS